MSVSPLIFTRKKLDKIRCIFFIQVSFLFVSASYVHIFLSALSVFFVSLCLRNSSSRDLRDLLITLLKLSYLFLRSPYAALRKFSELDEA